MRKSHIAKAQQHGIRKACSHNFVITDKRTGESHCSKPGCDAVPPVKNTKSTKVPGKAPAKVEVKRKDGKVVHIFPWTFIH